MFDVDSKSLRLLVAACELRNMKAAAAQEHLEPSAISKRIAQLEDRLGTPLLLRGRRGVEPTPAGLAMLEHARNVLFTLDRMRSDAEAFAGGIRGQVTVAASASAIAEALPDDVAAFMRIPEHREIRVVVEERFSQDVVRLVRDGVAALGVCWDTAQLDGLEQHPYRTDELALAMATDHPLATKHRVRYVEALRYEHVGLPPATAAHAMLARAAAQAGGQINYRAIVSTFDASLRVVAAGLAISVIPRAVVEKARALGVVTVGLAEPWAKRQFVICSRHEATLPPSALRLRDFLRERAKAAVEPEAPIHMRNSKARRRSRRGKSAVDFPDDGPPPGNLAG
jgi:DNA-binding transcriptional LysR family regulator